mmetsp:Transcript_58339/g.103681  ORF Transcript_58339/g.103681 Transcript_58339/m.103681 type:complete len:862 (+) Transcript_58339:8-2593(+)
MSSDWQKLADLWYRKREVYTTNWSDDPERLYVSVVAGAPYGGPVATVRDEHVFQPVRGNLKPELQTWTSAGRLINSSPWAHTGLLIMGWSSQEELVCVFESGLIRTFTVMCEPLHVFTIDERIKSEGGAISASLWPNGVAVLTRRFSLFVNASLTRSGDACFRCADLKVPSAPLCLCVLPPASDTSADIQVIVGTAEGPVLLADRHEARDIGLTDGPFMAFSVSSSGKLLACLSRKGVFKVLSITDDLQVLDVANLECRKKPKQMVWCGDDCIALYLAVPTPSNSVQHVLFVGGPQNDWIPYQYENPLHLVSECDGCRILGTYKVEFVQRVPPSTEAIFSIGSFDPPAMLCYALERYAKGDVCAQESLRPIKEDLSDAVATCIDAALCEHDPNTFKPLLDAAGFGRHFLTEPVDPDRNKDACKNLRICNDLRKAPIDIPMTVAQLEKLGIAGLALRLAQRHQHLLAFRICQWVGHPRNAVLFHWGRQKIRGAKGSPRTDEELFEVILAKFNDCPGIGYAEVARVAAEMYRPHLATMLLNHEPRSHAQVQVLLQLAREGDQENSEMMLRLAVEKAAQSWDPDLIHGAISAACGGDPCGRSADIQALARLIKERPQELQVVSDVFVTALLSGEQFDRARMYYDQIDRGRQSAVVAVHEVFRRREVEERIKWLRRAKDFFGMNDASASEAEKLSLQFSAQATAEESELLKAQAALEEQAETKRWLNGPHRFAGLSLTSTLVKLIELGEVVEADNLHTQMKVADKRYWRMKVRALSNAGNLSELNMLATHRSSPIGYELFIEAFLKHGRNDLAIPFVTKVKSSDQQAIYYSRMGMEEEAQRARMQGQERTGAGRLLQNILGVGRS